MRDFRPAVVSISGTWYKWQEYMSMFVVKFFSGKSVFSCGLEKSTTYHGMNSGSLYTLSSLYSL